MAPGSRLLSAVPSEHRAERQGTEASPSPSRAVGAAATRGAREGCPLGSRRGVGAASWPHAFRDRDLFHLGRTWHYPERWEGTSGQDTWVSSRWPKKPGEPVSACSLWGPAGRRCGHFAERPETDSEPVREGRAGAGSTSRPSARGAAHARARRPAVRSPGRMRAEDISALRPVSPCRFYRKAWCEGGSALHREGPPPAPGELCPCSASRGVFVLAGLSFRSAVLKNLNV